MAIKRIRKIKPQRLTKPNVLSFLAYTLILFFWATIFVNINPNANESYRQEREARNLKPMQRIFLADNGETHELFGNPELWEHWAPEDWKYLFPEQEKQEEIQNIWTGNILSGMEQSELWTGRENQVWSGKWSVHEILSLTGSFISTGDQFSWTFSEQNTGLDFITWTIEKGESTSWSLVQTGNAPLKFKTPKKAYGALWNTLEDRSVFINMIFEYLLRGNIVELPEGAVRYVVLLYGMEDKVKEKIFEGKSCMTPWGYEIEHWASVLAYEQRSDAPNICNLQRRICKNGKLSGKFIQASCDENLKGNIKHLSHITTNTEKAITTDEFIQPSKPPKNENADFNLHGQLAPNDKPHIISWPLTWAFSQEANEVPLQQNPRKFCEAPRWEKVQAGHFVKAYRFQNGFTDIPCKVQLRLCVDGELEGAYYYPSCQPWETSYEDFLNGYMDWEEPSPQRLLKMLKTDFNPDPEYWNNLSPQIIDKVLKILRE